MGSVHKSQAILSEPDCPYSRLLFISLYSVFFLFLFPRIHWIIACQQRLTTHISKVVQQPNKLKEL